MNRAVYAAGASFDERQVPRVLAAAPLEHRKISADTVFARPRELTLHIPTPKFRGSFPDLDNRNKAGGVAQLGERLNGIQEVRGSIPLASTVGPARGG